MNRFYRVVFNRSLGVWQAVPETAKAQGKGGRPAKALAVVLLALGATQTAGAADVIWSGAAGTDWETTANWDIGVPVAGDNALINVTGSQLVINSDQTVGSVVIGDAAVPVDVGLSVSAGSVTLSGELIINEGSTLRIGSAGDTGTLTVVDSRPDSFHAENVTLSIEHGTFRPTGEAAETLTNGSGSTLNVGKDGVYDLNGAQVRTRKLTGSGTIRNDGDDNALLIVDEKSEFGGVIADGSKATGLAVFSVETLTLTGTNTYTGGTIISGHGALRVGNGGTTGAVIGDVEIAGAGTLVFNRSNDYTFAGNISANGGSSTIDFVRNIGSGTLTLAGVIAGPNTLHQAGTGTTILTGANTYTGGTVISSGTLVVNGSLNSVSLVEVHSGATLGGSGTVGTVAVSDGGRLAPGNSTGTPVVGDSIGTLAINGDLVFDPGSRFEVEVDPQSSRSDQVNVSGNATLNGGSVAHVGTGGNYALRSAYTILTVDGTLAGKFDTVTSDFAFLTPVLQYDYGTGTVGLALTRNARAFGDDPAALRSLSRNHQATAGSIDSIGWLAGHAVYDAVAQLPDDPKIIRAGFDALSGEIHGSAKTALIEDSRYIRNAANDRMRAAFAAAGADHAPVQASGQGKVSANHSSAVVWTQAFGSWGSTGADDNTASLDRDTSGLLLGADRSVGDWRIGALAGYSHSKINAGDRASSAKSDGYHLGLYGGTQWDNLAVRTGAAYSWHNLDTQRTVAIPGLNERLSAENKAHTLQVFGELGYGIEAGSVRLEPFANLAYVRQHTDGYGERGGAAALSGGSQSTETTFTTLGLRGEHSMTLGTVDATLRGMMGWRHAFGDTTPESTHAFSAGNAFTVTGAPIARDSAVIEAGLDFRFTPDATLALSYVGQLSASAQDHGIKAHLSIRF